MVAGRPLPVASLAERMAASKTPGVSIAVINGGVVEWAKGYGMTEAGTTTPVTPHTLFQAASISKPVAALAKLRLVDHGKLSLDEPANTRLTSWKVPDNEFTQTEHVTLRRLLNHSAGLTIHGFGGYAAGTPVPNVIQVLDGQTPANSAAVRVNVVPRSLWRDSGGSRSCSRNSCCSASNSSRSRRRGFSNSSKAPRSSSSRGPTGFPRT